MPSFVVNRALATLIALSACACLTRNKVRSLYPDSEPRRPRSEVARLSGYIQVVDGQNVTVDGSGGIFELLPGCHVVVTPKRWGEVGSSGGLVATTGAVPFTLSMKPGYSYSIDMRFGTRSSRTGSLAIVAVETDPQGNVTAETGPAKSEEEVRRCLAEQTGP
jgi:hypothetical protein